MRDKIKAFLAQAKVDLAAKWAIWKPRAINLVKIGWADLKTATGPAFKYLGIALAIILPIFIAAKYRSIVIKILDIEAKAIMGKDNVVSSILEDEANKDNQQAQVLIDDSNNIANTTNGEETDVDWFRK